MPSLLIEKNGKHLCTAGSNGLFMISVGVWGDLWSKEASNLDITGGTEEQTDKRIGKSIRLIPRARPNATAPGDFDHAPWTMHRALCARDRPVRNAECLSQRIARPAQRHRPGARPARGS